MSRVLVIDDDFDTCEVIRLTLEYHGFDVHCLYDATAVFKNIAEFKPDVLIIDYLLRGGFNGCEICKRIKEDPATEQLPVILITAYLIKFDPINEFGFDAFLPKPFDISQIIDSVNRCIKHTE